MTDVVVPGGLPGHHLGAQEEALWLLQNLVPDRGVSNVGVAVSVPEPVRWRPLRDALRWLVSRHALLRSRYVVVDGRPRRVVAPAGAMAVTVDGFTTTRDALTDDMREYSGVAFDLATGPPVRLGLYDIPDGSSVICLVAHHIVVDHASLRILFDELATAYNGYRAGSAPAAVAAPEPADTATPPTSAAMRYWRRRIADADPAGMALHGERTPPRDPTFAGGSLWRRLPADLAAAVSELRRRLRATPNIVFLSAYYLLLHRHGAGPDLIVGVMLDARRRGTANDDADRALGYRVDTVPLRVRIDQDGTFADLVGEVREQLLGALAHPNVSYEMLGDVDVAAAGEPEPGWWRTRLFRHTFNFRGTALAFTGERLSAAPMEALHVDTGLARFDLELNVEADPDGPLCHLVYSTEVHDEVAANDLLDRYLTLLHAVAVDPGQPVSRLDIRTARDRAVVSGANQSDRRWPPPSSVLELVRRQTRDTPAAPAIVDGPDTVSYAQLLTAAAVNRDALARAGVRPGDVVAVAGPRGARTAAALLGIWAAGAAYLPVDASHPPARLEFELTDSGCRFLFDGDTLAPACRVDRTSLHSADPREAPDPAALADAPPVEPSAVAYLIYTSGSTGRPKGVRLTHGNLHNVVRHFATVLSAGPGDAMAWLTTLAFDISALELWLPLTGGGRVVVAPDEARALPELLLALVARERVTIVQGTPSTWRLVAPHAGRRLAGLRVLCGGEPLPPPLARRLVASGCRVFNVYGPTETTIWSTVAELRADDPEVTIGRPIANTRVHILDSHQREVPIGLPGELCIAGAGVGRGYVNLPDRNSWSFPDHPRLGRIYRTGDIGRWRPDGTIELTGRTDRQVKLNGHRVELSEIEAVLEEHPEVLTCRAVLHRADDAPVLAAYAVPADSAVASRPARAGELAEVLWRHCVDRLPRYAVPTRVRVMASLPLTGNGKVDNRLLESLAPAVAGSGASAEPDDPLTGKFLALWREMLGVDSLTEDANFFLSGGHSVLAVRLLERASAVCGTELPLPTIFRAPTPAMLARRVRTGRTLESEATK